MDTTAIADDVTTLAQALERDLLTSVGPLLGGEVLYRILGYRSGDAFRQAMSRNSVPVPVFNIAHRRGKFALSKEVALWLARQRLGQEQQEEVGHAD